MKRMTKTTLALALTALIAPSALAVDQDVRFAGIVLDSCALVIGTNGVLGQSLDQTVLSSKETGGASGTVIVTTNSPNSTIEVIAPTSFDIAPANADANTVFTASYSLAGDTVLSEILGDSISPLGLGVTTATIDANATKESGTFDAGLYELVTTVRCTSP
jgi:hypothetical protein